MYKVVVFVQRAWLSVCYADGSLFTADLQSQLQSHSGTIPVSLKTTLPLLRPRGSEGKFITSREIEPAQGVCWAPGTR